MGRMRHWTEQTVKWPQQADVELGKRTTHARGMPRAPWQSGTNPPAALPRFRPG